MIEIKLSLEKPIVIVQIKYKEAFYIHEIECIDMDRARDCAYELKEGISQIINIYEWEKSNGQN